MLDRVLNKTLKFLLLATAVTPLVYAPQLLFPYVLGKALFFRSVTELALLVFLVLLARSQELWQKFKRILKNPLVIAVLLFFLSAVVSMFVATDVYRAFWGEVERMEGLLTMAHFVVFFLMAAAVLEKKDWFAFIKLALVAGLVMAVEGILQMLNIEGAWTFDGRDRPDAFLGNSSYVGGHFLTLLFLAVVAFFNAERGTFWRYFALLMMPLSVAMIFFSATRGAMVALLLIVLLTGVMFWRRWIGNRKVVAGALIFVLLVAGFWLTRSNEIWQQVPGLDRLARISLSDATVQTRLIGWNSSWQAIQEKPILGWGPENFYIAYNQHFNPDYALYEAAWFDRAHNKLFDIGVMQGWLGLLLYFGIFGVALWQLKRTKNYWVAVPLAFLLIGYFIQNLFVFDHMSSYVMFFAALGMTVSWQPIQSSLRASVSERGNLKDSFTGVQNDGYSEWLKLTSWLLVTAVGVLIIYSLYAWHYMPYRQAREFIESGQIDDAVLIQQKSKLFLQPFNYTQFVVRSEYLDFLLRAKAFSDKELVFLTDEALTAYEEVIERESYDTRSYIRLSEAYNERARFQPEFYQKSEVILQKALELAPKRQDLYYHLAFTLFNEGERDAAVKAAETAIELSPNVGRSHYILAVIYSLIAADINSPEFRLKGEEALAKAMSFEQLQLLDQDYVNLGAIYSSNVVYYVQRRDADGVLRNAESLKKISPDIAADVDQVIELTKASKWTQLDQLLKISY